jgi:hypothetical protein
VSFTVVFCPVYSQVWVFFVCFAVNSTAEPRLGGDGEMQGSQHLVGAPAGSCCSGWSRRRPSTPRSTSSQWKTGRRIASSYIYQSLGLHRQQKTSSCRWEPPPCWPRGGRSPGRLPGIVPSLTLSFSNSGTARLSYRRGPGGLADMSQSTRHKGSNVVSAISALFFFSVSTADLELWDRCRI